MARSAAIGGSTHENAAFSVNCAAVVASDRQPFLAAPRRARALQVEGPTGLAPANGDAIAGSPATAGPSAGKATRRRNSQ